MPSSTIKFVLLVVALAVYTLDGYFKINTRKGNIARLQKAQLELLQELEWEDRDPMFRQPEEIKRQYDLLAAGEQMNRDQIKTVESDRKRAWIWGLIAWGIIDGWLLQMLSSSEFDPFEFRKG
jgi:hypothetical protein